MKNHYLKMTIVLLSQCNLIFLIPRSLPTKFQENEIIKYSLSKDNEMIMNNNNLDEVEEKKNTDTYSIMENINQKKVSDKNIVTNELKVTSVLTENGDKNTEDNKINGENILDNSVKESINELKDTSLKQIENILGTDRNESKEVSYNHLDNIEEPHKNETHEHKIDLELNGNIVLKEKENSHEENCARNNIQNKVGIDINQEDQYEKEVLKTTNSVFCEVNVHLKNSKEDILDHANTNNVENNVYSPKINIHKENAENVQIEINNNNLDITPTVECNPVECAVQVQPEIVTHEEFVPVIVNGKLSNQSLAVEVQEPELTLNNKASNNPEFHIATEGLSNLIIEVSPLSKKASGNMIDFEIKMYKNELG